MSHFRKFVSHIRSSSAWSPCNLWESEVTVDSRDPIVALSERFYQRYLHLVSSVFRISALQHFLEDLASWSLRESQRSATADNSYCRYIWVLLIGIVTSVFVCIDLESSSFAAVFRGIMFKQPATRIFPLGSLFTCLYIALHCLHCFVVTSFSGWICFAFHWRISNLPLNIRLRQYHAITK